MRDLNTDMSKIAFTPVIIALVAAILSLSMFAYAYAAEDDSQSADTHDKPAKKLPQQKTSFIIKLVQNEISKLS